ncbi:MAG: hypothetical protein ACYDAG_16335 [Chloroflexota bacterium]
MSIPPTISDRIMDDCRGALGEVRFGFGSKRQVWAFEERHRLDCRVLAEELADCDPPAFLAMAIAFHDEFSAVHNAWAIRDRIQGLASDLCRKSGPTFLAAVGRELVDPNLALRHWLVSALMSGPADIAFASLQAALTRAYQPADLWAILSRMALLSTDQGLGWDERSVGVTASLAQLSSTPEERARALGLLSRFGRDIGRRQIGRAAAGDPDEAVRSRAVDLLRSLG